MRWHRMGNLKSRIRAARWYMEDNEHGSSTMLHTGTIAFRPELLDRLDEFAPFSYYSASAPRAASANAGWQTSRSGNHGSGNP